jgi:homoserine O-succinyltransferase
MPTKIATETQLLRLLGNTPLQVEVVLLRTASHEAKNTDADHLLNHYLTFDEISDQRFDGLVITGAPVELLEFEEVDYWHELTRILDWAQSNVQSTLHLCWGAQAGLYHRYGIPKYRLSRKMFGVFEHRSLHPEQPLLRGFDETFHAPHSRHTEIRIEDLMKVNDIRILARSNAAGIHIVGSKDNRNIYVTGHPEYDPLTLLSEYSRDLAKGLNIHLPENYFVNDDPQQAVHVRWRSHAHLLFANWLNYCVYQATS